jgi:hypothetical protein
MNHIPSLYAHTFSGGVLFAGILYLIIYSSKIFSRDPYQIAMLILVLSIAIGIHGLSHVALESVYNFNLLSLIMGKQAEPYHPADCPYRGNCPYRANCPYRKNQ